MDDNVIKEIWKTYPQTEWVLGSNLGNLKTIDHYVNGRWGNQFVKGHVLPKYRMANGYMTAHICIDGKMKNLLVHRVIASCFIPNPDNLPQINHKNCVRDDNRVGNLEWCDVSYNNRYREKYGVSSREARGHRLIAVTLKTKEVLHFASQHEASQKTGISQGNIGAVIRGERLQAGGYWFTENENEITDEKIQSIKDNMFFLGGVIAINLEKPEPLYFESQCEAGRQLGFGQGDIQGVISGRRNKTHGFWFTYADENAIKNTRDKFGDKVASKVADVLCKE